MSIFDEIKLFPKDHLVHVDTIVTKATGEKVVETASGDQNSILGDPELEKCFREFFVIDASPDCDVHEVCDGLFISSQDGAANWTALQTNNIKFVLNLVTCAENHFTKEITYKALPMYDLGSFNCKKHFEECSLFIENSLQSGAGILVHCNAGVSRSSTVIIAYLVRYRLMGVDEALALIRENRPIAQPNPGFMKQLREYAEDLRGCNRSAESSSGRT